MMADANTKLHIKPTSIPEVLIVESKIIGDQRGWFSEFFNAGDFAKATGLNVQFVQDNHSFSKQWTLRGLHYQLEHTQGKLVRVVVGSVFDVVVDVRKNSPTFGQWVGEILSAENHRQIWIPPGFAHGFFVLSKTAECLYKTTDYYDPKSEVSLSWCDPTLKIQWPVPPSVEVFLSAKDAAGLSWDQAPKF